MAKSSRYVAKIPDRQGRIHYTDEEHATWAKLYARQEEAIRDVACVEYLHALEKLDLPKTEIPQCVDLSERLSDLSGWTVTPVPALINFEKFFGLLASKQLPAASFIRRPEDLDYLQEPDIFHEIFGHVPLLTDPRFAAFSQAYGAAGLAADKADHAMLARLYWFTVEFGLIREGGQLKIYGAGIMSSFGESQFSLSDEPTHKPFDVAEILATDYDNSRIQDLYFVIDSYEQLFNSLGEIEAAMERLAGR